MTHVRLASQIVRSICELDEAADPNDPNTVCAAISDIEAVIERHLEALAAPPQVEPAEGETPTDEEMTEAGKCLECGALDSEPCQAPCWREFHGGTREPRQEPLTDVQKSIRDGTFGVRSSS